MPSILVDCERMKYPNTGPYSVCMNLGQQLLRYKQDSEDLTFLVPSKLKGFFGDNADYKILRPINKLYLPWEKSRFMTGTSKYDVWHMTYQSTMYCPLNKRTKSVLTILDLNFLHENPNNPKNKKYLALIQNRVDRADYITTLSQFGLDDVRKHLKLGSKPASVIYLGHTFDNSSVTEPTYKPKRPFLFALGTVIPKKNFHVLPCLLAKNDRELVIAGNLSPYKEKIMEEAKRFNVEDRVIFAGPVSEPEKSWYYQHCDAFLFPSIAEGFGLPVIEAMYHGKPVFASTYTSLPEVGGEHAYYFRDFIPESMQGVFESGMEHFHRTQPSERIRQWSMKFNWANTAKEYLAVYRSLL